MAEKKIIKRRPTVNSKCIGCGACVAVAGDVFEFNNEGSIKVKKLDKYEGLGVDDSISACPVEAITWIEE